ncbi:hypothetical protein CRM22_006773 [Opisthorchis felineus]|uniref:Uncharacterized protein n=1 Tax=Opisthorchis felineus TaxID=147828 RepID=A0A4S2LQV2_OPIFE|nr:hypothetical protein CRM22_006773 [Opisthorchis felineus]
MQIITLCFCLSAFMHLIASKSTSKKSTYKEGLLSVTGEVYINKKFTYDTKWEDSSSPAHKQLNQSLCTSLRNATKSYPALAEAWRSCRINKVKKPEVTTSISLDQDAVKKRKTDYKAKDFLNNVKSALKKTPTNTNMYYYEKISKVGNTASNLYLTDVGIWFVVLFQLIRRPC